MCSYFRELTCLLVFVQVLVVVWPDGEVSIRSKHQVSLLVGPAGSRKSNKDRLGGDMLEGVIFGGEPGIVPGKEPPLEHKSHKNSHTLHHFYL